MEYIIINGFDAAAVAASVNERLREGWELHGSLAISAVPSWEEGGNSNLYAQAMTKKAPEQWAAS